MIRKIVAPIFLAILSTSAETLFYKTNRQAIASEEHKILYKLMLETQFPTSLAHGTPVLNEMEVLNEKIKKNFPNTDIHACFIPTTLYHLFCLKFMYENYREECKNGGSHLAATTDKLLPLLTYAELTCNEFKKANNTPSLQYIHHQINNTIIDIVMRYGFKVPFTMQDIVCLVDSVNFWQPLDINRYSHWNKNNGYLNIFFNQSLIKRAIAIDCHANALNKFPLYRGAWKSDDTNLLIDSNRSISFGSSLFGGIIYDPTGCAYWHINPIFGNKTGSVILLDKNEYIQGTFLKNTFTIPPLVGLLDLLGKGEYFHTRTKVVDFLKVNPFSFQARKEESLIPFYQITAETSEKAIEIYKQMLEYIKENHIVFSTSILPKDMARYFTQQFAKSKL